MKVLWSRHSVHKVESFQLAERRAVEGGAVVIWSILGAVSEEVALFTKVAKFGGTSWFPTIPCY